MWLKATGAEQLLAKNKLTRAVVAKLFGYSLAHINQVLDGKFEAGEDLARQFLAAFGAEEMRKAIDWGRTGYAG